MTKRPDFLIALAPHAWTGRFNWLLRAVPVTRKVRRLVSPMVAA